MRYVMILISTIFSRSNQQELDRLFKRIELEIRGHDKAVLNSYTKYLQMTCKHLEIEMGKVIVLPYVRWFQNYLKSKFAKKKNQLHYETRTHIRKVDIKHVTGSTASTFLEYIERNIPEGVAMKVTYYEIAPFPETVRNTMAELNESTK
ncbi:unnamed protein product [Dracunculus medinensis]|uniref:Small ribosomal subunit protein uS10m n=1 Tax=Dracunculus medinensis TaxID=318479 RepID=A0A3P7Q6N0_DRAME|nr:unnamed protein product [Dracunculus medinensis]